MYFNIRMGVPEMEDIWNNLCKKSEEESLKGYDKKLLKKLKKVLNYLVPLR